MKKNKKVFDLKIKKKLLKYSIAPTSVCMEGWGLIHTFSTNPIKFELGIERIGHHP